MATTSRARRSKNTNNSAASLIEALKFISEAQHKGGQQVYETHCVLANGWATAFNGILTIGHKIEEELTACPHTETLLTALQKCGEGVNITQLDNGKLSIKSGKFKALINCDTSGTLPTLGVAPDPIIAPINDDLKKGFEVVGVLADVVKDKHITDCSLLVRPGTVAATNRHVLLEYWHGLDLPPNMIVPKLATQAIVKTAKKLSGFGYSGNTATFHFEDGSYIKTQLYVEKWPAYEKLFPNNLNAWPLPEHFYEAVDALLPFVKENPYIYFDKGLMKTGVNNEDSSTYEVEGLPAGPIFNAHYLKLVQHCMKKADFSKTFAMSEGNRSHHVYFFGENVRGAIAGCAV